jgi:signal transduction histidine kinase
MGWLLLLGGLAGAVTTLGEVYAFNAMVRQDGPRWGSGIVFGLSSSSWVSVYALLSGIALIFPTGRVPSPRWRPFAAVCLVAYPAAEALAPLQPGPLDAPFKGVANPTALSFFGGAAGQAIVAVVMFTMMGCTLGCLVALVVRFRRAAGLEREQLKVLLLGCALTPVALGICFGVKQLTGSDTLAAILLNVAVTVVTVAVGSAVLRFRLYDVDRLVNRTLVYGALTVVLFGVYVLVATAVGAIAGGSRLSAALATAAIVLAFRPLRDFAQQQIDRRFARTSARARTELRAFVVRLRDGQAHPEDLRGVLAAIVEDPSLRLRVRTEGRLLDVHGRELEDEGVWVEIGTSGVQLSTTNMPDALLLHTIGHEASLALELTRLQAEIHSQSAFLAEAELRVALAGHEERRRMERDLHDGVQQRLVSLGLQLRRMQRSLPSQALILEPALDGAVREISSTLTDLRRLASGDRPACLERGLHHALEELARGLPVPVQMDLPGEALPERVEAAAYFLACEAVTNAIKHSRASIINLRAAVVGGALEVEVSDDGVGGAVAGTGSGLVGLAARLREHGGSLDVRSPIGGGTTLRAVIPCGS